MPDYGYSTPYRGMPGGALPAGYLEAATAPGRAIGAGIAKAGDRIWDAIQKYKDHSEQNDYYTQQATDMAQTIHDLANRGNIADPNSPESQLIAGVMRSTKAKSPDDLIDLGAKIPSMSLGAKKALAQDLQFHLNRYDTQAQRSEDNQRKDAQEKALAGHYSAMQETARKQQETMDQYRRDQIDAENRKLDLEAKKLDAPPKLTARQVTDAARVDAATQHFTSVFGQPTEDDLTAITQSAAAGQYKPPTGLDAKNLYFNGTIGKNATALADQINAFNAKYGAKADGSVDDVFGEHYTGFINEWEDKGKRMSKRLITPRDVDAYNLIQQFQTQFNIRGNALDGTRITPQNKELLDKSLGAIKSGNFVNELNQFAKDRSAAFVEDVERMKGSRRIEKSDAILAHQLADRHALTVQNPIVNGEVPPMTPPTVPTLPPADGWVPAGRFELRV